MEKPCDVRPLFDCLENALRSSAMRMSVELFLRDVCDTLSNVDGVISVGLVAAGDNRFTLERGKTNKTIKTLFAPEVDERDHEKEVVKIDGPPSLISDLSNIFFGRKANADVQRNEVLCIASYKDIVGKRHMLSLLVDAQSVLARFWDRVGLMLMDMAFMADASNSILQVASRDALTGILNRSFGMEYFKSGLEHFFAQNEEKVSQSAAVIMFDIDHFKSVNDRFGHDVGDQVICQVSSMAKKQLRENSVIFRYGGEEFCIGLYNCDNRCALSVLQRLHRSLCPVAIPEVDGLSVTVSMGCALFSVDRGERLLSDKVAKAIKEADQALYASKAAGRKTWRIYSGDGSYIGPEGPERISAAECSTVIAFSGKKAE